MGEPAGGATLPLMRLRCGGSAHRWGLGIHLASTGGYENQIWVTGSPKKPSTSSATST